MSVGASGSTQRQNTSGTQNTTQSQQGTSTTGPWGPISGYLQQLAGDVSGMGNRSTPYFPGQGYVSPSSATQQGVNMGMSAMPYYQGAASQAAGASPTFNTSANMAMGAIPTQQGINNVSLGNYGFLSNAADVANNPYVQGQLGANQRQVTQALNEQWLPQINSGAQEVNALGSTRHGVAQAQGIERAANQLANTNASTMLGAYGQGLTAQQNALGQTGNVLANQLAPAQAAGYAGQQQLAGAGAQGQAAGYLGQGAESALGYGQNVEGYQQQALDDAINRFNYQYEEPWQRAQNVGNLIGNLFGNYGTTTSSQTGTSQQAQNQTGRSSGFGAKVGTK